MPYLLPLPRLIMWLFAVVAVAVVALLIAAAFADSADAYYIFGRRVPR